MTAKNNPRAGNAGAVKLLTAAPSLVATAPRFDDVAPYFRDSYAVLVRGKTTRRHLYSNLPAATNAVARAHARGDRADLILVRLVPVDARQLDQLDEWGGDAA